MQLTKSVLEFENLCAQAKDSAMPRHAAIATHHPESFNGYSLACVDRIDEGFPPLTYLEGPEIPEGVTSEDLPPGPIYFAVV